MKIEEEETINGLNIKVRYMKIRVYENWYRRNEEKEQIEEMNFRDDGGKKG